MMDLAAKLLSFSLIAGLKLDIVSPKLDNLCF